VKKFEKTDKEFFEARKAFEEAHQEIPFWFGIDNWSLFAGSVNIARKLAIYELVQQALELPGHIAELGCWNGNNLVFMAKLVKIFKPNSLTEVFGFDSFEGLENFTGVKDKGEKDRRGSYKGDLATLEEMLRIHQLDDFTHLIKGNVLETLEAFLEKRQDVRFSLIYLDMDLYEPTKYAIEKLYPRLLSGGLMVFDEYNTAQWPGETSAVHEVLGDDAELIEVPYTRQPRAYLIKP
jgi:SAM-dependent methyltransferase